MDTNRNKGRSCGGMALMCGLVLGVTTVSAASGTRLLSTAANSSSTINLADLPNLASASERQPFSPSPATNFQALMGDSTFAPPNIAAAVGTNRLMVAMNTGLSIQDKGGTALFTTTLSNFWNGLGVVVRVTQPRLAYDPVADRWIFAACADPQSPTSSLLLAISMNGDPATSWHRYRISVDPTNHLTWGSDLNLGFNDDWIVVTKTLRPTTDDQFSHTRLYAFDKTKLYESGPVDVLAPTVLRAVIEDSTVSSLVPSVSYDRRSGEMFLIANGNGDDGHGRGYLRLFRLAESSTSLSLAEVARPVSDLPWSDVPITRNGELLPQRGSRELIGVGDSRIQNVVLRNGSLWCAQTIFLPAGNGARAAAQWWQIDPSGTVVQVGRVDDPFDGVSYAYPSIAVNRNSDVLLGYSFFYPFNYPSAGYSFRFGTDPASFMQSITVFKSGESAYEARDPATGRIAWGEYSATVVDPLNDLDLWTVQEYASYPITGIYRWGTWWAKVKLANPPDGNLEVVIDPPSGAVIPGGIAQVFSAQVTDTIGISNATVDVEVLGFLSNRTFVNNGLPPDAMATDHVYTRIINFPPTNRLINAIFTVRAVGKHTLRFTNTYSLRTPPANDHFADAIKIPEQLPAAGGIFTGHNHFTSVQAQEPNHAGVTSRANSVWWYWSPGVSGAVLIDTVGSQFDTVLGVYTNSSLFNLAEVASGNDVTDEHGHLLRHQAFVKFNVLAGHTYRIAVSGANSGEIGSIRLRMAFDGNLDVTAPILEVTNIVSGNTTATLPVTNLVVNEQLLTISGTAFDREPDRSEVRLVRLMHDGSLGVNVSGSNEWTASIVLRPGTNSVQIQAIDLAGNRSATTSYSVVLRLFDPLNDVFTNAVPLAPQPGSVQFNNQHATVEPGEPWHANKIPRKSVWFSFVPPEDGVLFLSTTNSMIDTVLALYAGDRIDNLRVVAANDDEGPGLLHSYIRSGVSAGQQYRIAIDGLDGASGPVVLHHWLRASDFLRLTVNSTPGGQVVPGIGVYVADDVVELSAQPEPGFGFVSWTGETQSLDNPLRFTIRSNTTLNAIFTRFPWFEDFESAGFSPGVGWLSEGNVAWNVEPASVSVTNSVDGGRYFARSGAIGHNQLSDLKIVRAMRAGPASFDYKLSTEVGFDVFEFSINGSNLLSRSGITDWTKFTFTVPAGTNTIRWLYRRNGTGGSGLDAVFLDNVNLPLRPSVHTNVLISLNRNAARLELGGTGTFSIVPVSLNDQIVYGYFKNSVFFPVSTNQPSFALTNVAIRQFQIQLEGQTNQRYRIEASVDLGNWVTLATNRAPFGFLQFTDQNSTNHTRRFYRTTTVD